MIKTNRILAVLSVSIIAIYIVIAGVLTIAGSYTFNEFLYNLSEVFVGVAVVGLCFYRSFN